MDELKEVNLGSEGEHRPTYISAYLSEEETQAYISFPKEYRDVFAWNYNEISGFDLKSQFIDRQLKLVGLQ